MTAIKGLVTRFRFDNPDASDLNVFDEMGKCVGRSMNGASEGVISKVDGKFGKCFDFNGSDEWINVYPEALSNEGSLSGFTIACWVYIETIDTNPRLICDSGYANANSYAIFTQKIDSVDYIFFGVGNNVASSNYAFKTVTKNVWHFVVGIWNGTTVQIYVDLVAGTSSSLGGTFESERPAMVISYYPNRHDGKIDEFKVYNRALNENELLELYYETPKNSWVIQYFNSYWKTFSFKKHDNISEELRGDEIGTFKLLNTATNRAIVLNDYPVRFLFNYNIIFEGLLRIVDYDNETLTVGVVNSVYDAMDRTEYSGGSFESTAANSIMASIFGTGAGIFGNQSLGSQDESNNVGFIDSVRVQMADISGATCSKLSFYCWSESGTANVTMAIYEDDGGEAGDFVAQTVEVGVTTTPSWVDFTFSSPPTLTANAYYWFAWKSENRTLNKGAIGYIEGNHKFIYHTYDDPFPDPFDEYETPTENDQWQSNIYGTLTGTYEGDCPTTSISAIKFGVTTRMKASLEVAKQLDADFWSEDGLFNIGIKNRCVLALSFDEGTGMVASDSSGNGHDFNLFPAYSTFTFGRTDTGNGSQGMSGDTKAASSFSCSNDGKLINLKIRCRRTSSSGYMRAALYADSGGSPAALIAQTEQVWCGTTSYWRTFPFTEGSEPLVINGLTYWIALSSGGSYTYVYNTAVSDLEYNSDTYSNGFNDPFGSSSSYSHEMCAYASGISDVPTWVEGKYGNAVSFQGAQYGTIPHTTKLDDFKDTNEFTVAQWLYIDTLPTTGYACLFSRGWADEGINIHIDSGTVYVWIGVNGSRTQVIAYGSIGSYIDDWHHFVVTMKNGICRLYIDGDIKSTSSEYNSNITATSTPNYYINQGTDYWIGYCDETLFYNYAFSEEQIKLIYNQNPHHCHRKINRARKRQRLVVKGFDLDGNQTQTETGSGEDMAVITRISPANSTSLEDAAAELLTKLQDESQGGQIEVPIEEGVFWKTGDSIPLHIPRLALDGIPRIRRIDKKRTTVSLIVEKTQNELLAIMSAMNASDIEQVATRVGVTIYRQASAPSTGRKGDLWFENDVDPVVLHVYDGTDWNDTLTPS